MSMYLGAIKKTVISQFITLILGALLSQMDHQEILAGTIAILMVLFIMYAYASLKDTFLGEDIQLAKALKSDLQYISTTLPEENI